MAINWFPGHMHKAQKEIKEILPQIDVVIEVCDARLPFSSENPMITEIRGDKPLIKILNKSDLADANKTKIWLEYLESQHLCLLPSKSPAFAYVLGPVRRFLQIIPSSC